MPGYGAIIPQSYIVRRQISLWEACPIQKLVQADDELKLLKEGSI